MPTDPDTRVHMLEGRLSATWEKGDKEFENFVRVVWRLFGKLATNKYSWIDTDTFEIEGRITKGRLDRIGHRALEWALQDPRHIISDHIKPLDWQPPA